MSYFGRVCHSRRASALLYEGPCINVSEAAGFQVVLWFHLY